MLSILQDCYVECLTVLVYLNSAAAHQEFVSYSARLKTFHSNQWNHEGNGFSVEQFADAGFYFVKMTADHVTCYFCNLGLKDWSHMKDPILEHARFSPLCFHVKSMCGLNFVKEVAASHLEQVNFPAVYEQANHGGLLSLLVHLWQSYLAKAVISVGFNHGEVFLFFCRIWIRERRIVDNVTIVVKDLQAQWGPNIEDMDTRPDLSLLAESYYRYLVNFPDYKEFSLSSLSAQPSVQLLMPSFEETTRTVGQNPFSERSQAGHSSSNVEAAQQVQSHAELHTKVRKEHKVGKSVSKTCWLCGKREFEITCLPCGHLSLCQPCSVTARQCPACYENIVGHVRTYLT